MAKDIGVLLASLARAHRNNGKGATYEQLVSEGAEEFRLKVLREATSIVVPEKDMPRYLLIAGVVNSLRKGREFCEAITIYDIDVPKGYLSFEKAEKKIIISYEK